MEAAFERMRRVASGEGRTSAKSCSYELPTTQASVPGDDVAATGDARQRPSALGRSHPHRLTLDGMEGQRIKLRVAGVAVAERQEHPTSVQPLRASIMAEYVNVSSTRRLIPAGDADVRLDVGAVPLRRLQECCRQRGDVDGTAGLDEEGAVRSADVRPARLRRFALQPRAVLRMRPGGVLKKKSLPDVRGGAEDAGGVEEVGGAGQAERLVQGIEGFIGPPS